MENTVNGILAIDIGGSHIKMTILDAHGKLLKDYEKVVTPMPATPSSVLAAIQKLETNFESYGHISVGFPGYVKDDIIITAPNLGNQHWQNVQFAKMLTDTFHKPARVINDADMQGLGIASGKGLEIVITLGTGFGTAFLLNGKLLPHQEMAHHPFKKGATYDEYIGDKALQKLGTKKWNKRFQKILPVLKTVFNFDTLYLGGGNASKLILKPDPAIKIVGNKDGIHGGAKLWDDPIE